MASPKFQPLFALGTIRPFGKASVGWIWSGVGVGSSALKQE